MKKYIVTAVLLSSLSSLTIGKEASEETHKAVSNFIARLVSGQSHFFGGRALFEEGRVISGYEIAETTQDEDRVQVKVRYNVVGRFNRDETAVHSKAKIHPQEQVIIESYEFIKKDKTYTVERGKFPSTTYILKSKLL